MVEPRDLEQKAGRLQALIRDRFGIDQRDLSRAARKLGRRVPRKVRQALVTVQVARARALHPKLRLQIDKRAVETAYVTAHSHLEAVDKWDRRKGAMLGLLGGLSFNLIVLGVLVLAVLLWRGLV